MWRDGRSIPAHAGKPPGKCRTAPRRAVYPRPRGEASEVDWNVRESKGLSPPTRGSPLPSLLELVPQRSIPAHAGKPEPAIPFTSPSEVYPRPRGEASYILLRLLGDYGLSPPTRGSHDRSRPGHRHLRSIPAHAGKPWPAGARWPSTRVYPRPRGEAAPTCRTTRRGRGLSPPTRGSHDDGGLARLAQRSIPAHAGKPPSASTGPHRAWVYPRPRGEAMAAGAAINPETGLSPPTRGSHTPKAFRVDRHGSIPAHAGKPRGRRVPHMPPRVYPRPRGEATAPTSRSVSPAGLSPPTRGSRSCRPCRGRRPGSIPAHAGKPTGTRAASTISWVYPRPRGEALAVGTRRFSRTGLSPPTRGSPSCPDNGSYWSGSIPAHAGKPSVPAAATMRSRVYPRPRGEAMPTRVISCSAAGLSPPTRGSPPGRGWPPPVRGSIPAHAGKPV